MNCGTCGTSEIGIEIPMWTEMHWEKLYSLRPKISGVDLHTLIQIHVTYSGMEGVLQKTYCPLGKKKGPLGM